MLDSFNVIIDTLTDLLQPLFELSSPIISVVILVAAIVFAWKSTEVPTEDDVQGQFTIPGRGIFNVIRSVQNISGRQQTVQSEDENNAETAESSREEEQYEAGNLSENEVNINVRYLDESVMSCSFRPSQSLGHFKRSNWEDEDSRKRVCLIYAGKALRDDHMQMRRIGLKEGDTMHAFYKNPPETTSSSSSVPGSSSTSDTPFPEDDFDELARYFLPLAGSLLLMTWVYLLSSPIMISLSTLLALVFITTIYSGFAIYNYRSLIS